MKYDTESIISREVTQDDLEYTVFDIVLKEPVNGVGCASVPAETEEEALEKFDELVKNHVHVEVV